MDLGIRQRTALICGGSDGIGFGIAKILAQEGANVVIGSRDSNRREKAVEELRQWGMVQGVALDMSDLDSVQKAARQFEIEILVTNSGGPAAGFVTDVSLKQWDEGYQQLLKSLFVFTQECLPRMKQNRWGRILNITSTAAIEMIPKLPISATFRAGISAWTRNLSKEIGGDGILINNLLPGPIATNRLSHLDPVMVKAMVSETAVKRLGDPDEVGRAAAFLVSAANTFITGTDVLVDGGYTRSY